MKFISNIAKTVWTTLIGPRATTALISLLAKLGSIDLLFLAHEKRGIGLSENLEVSGENYLLQHKLPEILGVEPTVCFDVGAHNGEFSLQLKKTFPLSRVIAFEPSPSSFKVLKARTESKGIEAFNVGLGSLVGELELYDYDSAPGSQHASVYSGVFDDIHKSDNHFKISIPVTSLNDFCKEHAITKIDFLKIDVEGHELEVLKGASSLLKESRINVIQFEFNEMNVSSRVYLHDFYEILNEFNFFRVLPDSLLALKEYTPVNEIFRFQNILAVRKC